MKKWIIKIAMLCFCNFLLVSCSGKEDFSELGNEYKVAVDDQYYFNDHVMAKSNKGYYINYDGQKLYYMDENKKLIPVCAKLECNHEDFNCSATKSAEGFRVYVHNNKLYFVTLDMESLEYWLYEANLDGSEQTKLAYLFKQGDDGITYELMLHRGYAYFFVANHSMIDSSVRELYRIELNKNAKKETIDTVEGYGSSFIRVVGYGEYVYYQKGSFDNKEGDNFRTDLYRFDINTCKTNKVYSGTMYDYYVDQDELFFMNDSDMSKLNIETGKIKNVFTIEAGNSGLNFNYDGTYFYIDNAALILASEGEKEDKDRVIQIFDKAGENIKNLKIGNRNKFIYGDEQYLFLYNDREIPEGTNAIVSVYDKSQITSNNDEWVHIEGE